MLVYKWNEERDTERETEIERDTEREREMERADRQTDRQTESGRGRERGRGGGRGRVGTCRRCRMHVLCKSWAVSSATKYRLVSENGSSRLSLTVVVCLVHGGNIRISAQWYADLTKL